MRDYNIRTAAAVLHDTSTRCTYKYSSFEPLVLGAAYLVPGTVHTSTYKSEVWGSVSRVKTPCEQGLPQ